MKGSRRLTSDYVANDLPTPAGLWRMAGTYADAAQILIDAGEPGQHQFDEPALHLAEQAIELALKGFLRGAGQSPDDLKGFGHNLTKLLNECSKCGLNKSFLADNDTMRVIRVLEQVGKEGQGFRYPCNADNKWVEPNVAVSIAKRLIDLVKKQCTTGDLSAVSALIHPSVPSDLRTEPTLMFLAFQEVGFVVTHERGSQFELELPGLEFTDLEGFLVRAIFHATVQSDTDGVVIALNHASHGSELRPAYGQTHKSAAFAAKIAGEEWIILANQVTKAALCL